MDIINPCHTTKQNREQFFFLLPMLFIQIISLNERSTKQRDIYLIVTVSKDDHEDTLLCLCMQACNRTQCRKER